MPDPTPQLGLSEGIQFVLIVTVTLLGALAAGGLLGLSATATVTTNFKDKEWVRRMECPAGLVLAYSRIKWAARLVRWELAPWCEHYFTEDREVPPETEGAKPC
jgi:hypothetical protein